MPSLVAFGVFCEMLYTENTKGHETRHWFINEGHMYLLDSGAYESHTIRGHSVEPLVLVLYSI